jgi:putative endonuclease
VNPTLQRASTVKRGTAAEAFAALYLEAQGLSVLARNLRCKAGELDIVCLDGDMLVIVEVRQRDRADYGGALGSVTLHKQRKLVRAANFYWQREPDWRHRIVRFDVLALQGAMEAPAISWIKDAFRAA